MADSQPTPPQQIQIQDGLAGGEYANVMQVFHNKEEFYLVFASIMQPRGRVVSKIITSPGHLKRIVAALQDNVKKYEATFGTIEIAESPQPEIGFRSS